MPRGKAVLVHLIKWERATEDETGASGPISETACGWRFLAGSLAGQDSMAWLKVLGD